MSSRVHFRFSSSTDFDFVLFNGDFITVGELKYLISKKTGVLKDRNTVIELFDSRTEDEYKDASTMIAKNASVIAKRSPAVKAPIISTLPSSGKSLHVTPTSLPVQSEAEGGAVDDEFGPDAFAPDVKSNEDDAAISELVKGFGEVWRTDLNAPGTWGRGRGTRGRDGNRSAAGRKPFLKIGRPNLPPLGYICHRCNIPGHFIDECPTNGDPAYDFVRVRYPTGIPATMLVKDDQGGLLMPNGERARLRPNTEKFKQEMEGVPGGDGSGGMKLIGDSQDSSGVAPPRCILDNKQLEELSVLLCNNPLSSITPLVMNVLPNGRDSDLQKGFFNPLPLDEQSFQRCKEEFHRAKALFEENSRPNSPTTTTRRDPPPNSTSTNNTKEPAPVQESALFQQPRQTRTHWNNNGSFYQDEYYHHPQQLWSGNVHQVAYDPYYAQARYQPPPPPFVQPMPRPPLRGDPILTPPQRTLHSEAVRIQHPSEATGGVYHKTLTTRSSSPRLYEQDERQNRDLPYGFGGQREERRDERYPTMRHGGSEGDQGTTRSVRIRSRSRTRHVEELRTSEDEMTKRKSRRKHDQHRIRRKRQSSENSTPRLGPPGARSEDGLDRWELEGPLSTTPDESRLDPQRIVEGDIKSRKKRRADRRSVRDSHGKVQD